MREYTLDQVNIPRMYFQEQSSDFENKTEYLSNDFKAYLQQEADDREETSSSNHAGPAKRQMPAHETSKRLRNT